MEIIIYVLMLFILLNCVFKLSLWPWWQRIAYSVILAAFVYWSQEYAILQSKTQLADYLQNTVALQNMAIIVTIESVFCFGFVACYLQDAYDSRPRWWQRVLYWYPSLLMFPVMFYALTQTIFTMVGVDFGVTALAFAAGVIVGIPLLAEGVKWLLPERDSRVEIQLLLTCFVCVMGLLSTENGKMLYKVNEAPIDLKMVAVSVGVFVVLFITGYAATTLKWKFRK